MADKIDAQQVNEDNQEDSAVSSDELAAINEAEQVGKLNTSDLGSSGTRIFGRIFDEEYLSKLTGIRRADVFDEIVRSDDTVTMLLTARKNPVLKANWSIVPAKGDTSEEDEMYARHAKHCEHEFFERMKKDFKEFLEEALTFEEQGFSLFERVHERVIDPKFGQYIGYKNIGWRSQRTIERWTLNKDGSINTVFQEADGDLHAYIEIPGQWVTVFTHRKKGDNYEGISALRPLYGNWQRKSVFLKLLAIGLERYAIRTPVGKIPAQKEESPEKRIFEGMLAAISSHQKNFMTLPAGWEVEFLENPFDVEKVVSAIKREDEGMVRSFVANHLNLGQGGSSGAYALGTDLSDQFLSIIENDAEIIIRRFNKELIKEFIDFNYGVQTRYPKLKVTGINDKFSKEFAEILKVMADAKYITPTENLEIWLRKKLDVPELLEADKALIDDVRKQEQPSLFNEQRATFADTRKTKAKVKEQIESSGLAIAEGMTENLRLRLTALVDRLFKELKGESQANWQRIIRNQGDLKNQSDYEKKLKKALAETAARAIAQARNEVPGGRKVEFAEKAKSRLAFGEVEDALASLPKKVRELILTDAAFATETQFVSLKNSVLLKASAGVDETSDLAVLHKRTLDQIDARLVGQGETGFSGQIITAANNMASKVYNTARLEFFQAPDVLEKIEAFQFVNTDPVSPICQDLNGRVFAKNDPESDQYLPPLHHNCKSFIVPIFDLQGKKVSEIGLKPSDPTLDKFKTL